MDGDDRTFETADGLLGVDREHRIVLWNEAAEAMFGFTAQEAVGRPCYEVICGGTNRESRSAKAGAGTS